MKVEEQEVDNINVINITYKKYDLQLLDIGGSIYKLKTFDKFGQKENIVLSYDDLHDYTKKGLYLGANIGRFAGRLENGKIVLNDKKYFLEKNDNQLNFLHGGSKPLHSKKMKYKIIREQEKIIVTFFSCILEKDDGIPGDIDIKIEYVLDEDNIKIIYYGKSNKDTILNITNHSYFNLSGSNKDNIKSHILKGKIDSIYKTDENSLPKEKYKTDIFNKGSSINDFIEKNYPSILSKKGIDNPFSYSGNIVLENKKSGRKLELSSSYKNLILYTQHFEEKQKVINESKERIFQGLAIEFQNLPNSIEESFLKKDNEFEEYINIKVV